MAIRRRKGELYAITYFYPEIGQTDRQAINRAVEIWVGQRFDWYHKTYILPLVDGWQNKNVPFFIKKKIKGGGTWRTESIPFIYLDGGAEQESVKRKIIMEPGNPPKTKLRKFSSSGPGTRPKLSNRGKKVFFSRKNKGRKFKRIRPRKWMIEIGKREQRLLGGPPRRGLAKPGVILSIFEQSIYVKNMNSRWTRKKLQGAQFVTPADPYMLTTVKKKETVIKV